MSRNWPDVRRACINTIVGANQAFVQAHGLEVDIAAGGFEDPLLYALHEQQATASTIIRFDTTRRHAGPMLTAAAFALRSLSVPFHTDIPKDMAVMDILRSRPLVIAVETEGLRTPENWRVWVTRDSPPYAIHEADAQQVDADPSFDTDALRRVREGFGEDAVPILTIDEAALLVAAMRATPAWIAESSDHSW